MTYLAKISTLYTPVYIKHATAHNGKMAPMYIEICRKTT